MDLDASRKVTMYGEFSPIYYIIVIIIIIIIIIIINMYAAWARVALPRGPECHVASTWPRVEINRFLPFLLILNVLNRKIKSEKSRKIPKNCKNHNFQNTTPN